MNTKVFDRSVCFTFFADYRITAKEIEEEFGVEDALNYYNALTDYALFETEPNLKGAVKFLWPTTKASLDSSIERRKKGFRNEDTETTQEIINYKNEHPEAAQREIAAAVNCSVGKVNKVLKRNVANSDTDSSFNSISTSSSEREHERSQTQEESRKKKRDLEDLPNEELERLVSMFQEEYKYVELYEVFNLKRGTLDKGLPARVSEIKKAREKQIVAQTFVSKLQGDKALLSVIADKVQVTPEECVDQLKQLNIEYEALRRAYEDDRINGYIDLYYEDSAGYGSIWEFLEMMIESNYKKIDGEWAFDSSPLF